MMCSHFKQMTAGGDAAQQSTTLWEYGHQMHDWYWAFWGNTYGPWEPVQIHRTLSTAKWTWLTRKSDVKVRCTLNHLPLELRRQDYTQVHFLCGRFLLQSWRFPILYLEQSMTRIMSQYDNPQSSPRWLHLATGGSFFRVGKLMGSHRQRLDSI